MSGPVQVEVRRCPKCRNSIARSTAICPVCGCSVPAAQVMRCARWLTLTVAAGLAAWYFAHR